eukprot:m.74852 g.74852  ORF g.74852 m.74852 type:complete len:53 (+) comp50372_c0_seq1:835-993(+)
MMLLSTNAVACQYSPASAKAVASVLIVLLAMNGWFKTCSSPQCALFWLSSAA